MSRIVPQVDAASRGWAIRRSAASSTIRLKLLKLGARITVSVRRLKIAIASACPHHAEFSLAHARLRALPG